MVIPSRSASSIRQRLERVLAGRARRPVAVIGPSGSGKTAGLRESCSTCGAEPLWTTARDVVDGLTLALRSGDLSHWRTAFANDPRPLVMEHVEDLRGKPRTMEELRQLLGLRLASAHAVVLTLTTREGAEDVLDWLRAFSDVIRLRDSPTSRVRSQQLRAARA